MKLERLKLSNFRGFRELEISFDATFTVLLGGNMAGKSAVLESAAVALSPLLGRTAARPIADDEVYRIVAITNGVPELQARFPVVVKARVRDDAFHDGHAEWALSRDNEDPATRPDGTYTILNTPLGTELPILAQYSVHRQWDKTGPVQDLRGIGSRSDAYVGCFDIKSTHAELAGWMRKQTLIQLQRGPTYVQPQLAAVESAVKACIDDVTRFWFDVQYDELRLERAGGDIQSFAMLSEGVRNMVAMVADIAWRTAVLNPQHGAEAHSHTAGVVLIDELELHLHPAWQRRVVADLQRTFPEVQFIVTTHSPQIVASVSRSQVRLMDRNRLVAEQSYVEGRDTNEILEDVFGVPPRPEKVQTEIAAMYRSIEDEDFAEARSRLAALQERLGPDDAAVIRAKWIIETEEAQPGSAPSAAP
jgi:predicted ATP-binding protein involved in virulence